MNAKLKIALFFGSQRFNNNSEDSDRSGESSLLQLPNRLANLEYSVFTRNKYTNLRILEFVTNNVTNSDIELWCYYGNIVNNSMPAICLHQISGIAVVGGNSVANTILRLAKPVIWYSQDRSSLQKASNLTTVYFNNINEDVIKDEFNAWIESKFAS